MLLCCELTVCRPHRLAERAVNGAIQPRKNARFQILRLSRKTSVLN